MFVICPDFNNVGFDKDEAVRFANDQHGADIEAAQLALKFPKGEIYIFRAVRKVKLQGKPVVNTYTIDEKGQVLPA